MSSKRYSPKVADLMAIYARNYRSVQRLLTQARRQLGDCHNYRWHHQQQPIELELQLTEQTKYTERVVVSRHDKSSAALTTPAIELRVYHDAQLAEVLTGQQFSRFLPVYPYPNDSMLQRDEKFQVNLFVAELLGQFHHREWQLDTSQENRKP